MRKSGIARGKEEKLTEHNLNGPQIQIHHHRHHHHYHLLHPHSNGHAHKQGSQ